MPKHSLNNYLRTGLALIALCSITVFAHAQTAAPASAPATNPNADAIKQQIDQHNQAIQQLNQEIIKYQAELDKTSQQAQTLQSAVKTLNVTQSKLGTDLKVTQNKIGSAELTIGQLENQINIKEQQIAKNKAAVAESLRDIQSAENESLMESMLTGGNLSAVWDNIETMERFQSSVQEGTAELKKLENDLIENKSLNESEKQQLLGYKDQITDKKKVIDQNAKEKTQLLTATKSQESAYQQLVADRLAKKNAFEKELLDFESQLKINVDPTSFPAVGSKVLTSPLDKFVITQQFGDTDFARANPGAYNGHGHNGIDLAASIGTPVKAALNGVVKGTGNTDTVCYKASYGQWVLIEHPDGLSTLYAHLSVIKVVPGQTVSTGDLIGYSGNTGYTTGPHLHFTVYATQGVKIMQRQSAVCAGAYTMPIADLKAYLNPLLYL